MLGVGLGAFAPYRNRVPIDFPVGFDWDRARFDLDIEQVGGQYRTGIVPRDLVDPAIWREVALHVDGAAGDDGNSGLGAEDGDFANGKRTIHAALVAGNATGAPYRVLVKAGDYAEGAFTRNGNDEPDQPVAVIGWGGALRYRAGLCCKLFLSAHKPRFPGDLQAARRSSSINRDCPEFCALAW